MAVEKIVAKLGKEEDAPGVEVTYDFGTNLEEAEEMFGAEVVFNRFKAAVTVDLQALARRHLSGEKPKTPEEIQAIVDEWKPGLATRSRKSKKEKAMELLDKLTPEEREELMAQLRAA